MIIKIGAWQSFEILYCPPDALSGSVAFFMSPTDSPLNANSPLVSVIIPFYNADDHIGTALRSVFAQEFKNFEVIVVNDGSPNNEQLECALRPYMSRITYLSQENRGPSAARNLAIGRAQGELLAFLDSDDTWLPEYLAEQTKLLQAPPWPDLIYCDAFLVGDPAWAGKTFMQVCPSNGPVTFESLLVEESQIVTSGTVARRQCVIAAGLFDERFRCAEDHDLWLRIAYHGGKIAYHRKVLVRRLVRPDSLGSPPGNLLAGEIGVLKKLDRELALSPEASALLAGKVRQVEALLCYIRGKNSLLVNDSQKAYDLLRRAHALSPTMKLRILLAGLRSAPRLTLRAARMWYRLEKEWIGTAPGWRSVRERPSDNEKASSSARGTMSVLRCLKCSEKLDCGPDQCVCQGCGAAWPVSGGIPRFFQTQDHYWGEVGRKEALQLLEAARRGSWADAVRTHFPKDDNMRFGMLDLQRASWAPMLGLDEQSRVLDIGSGYGAITHSLSRFAGEVYSIEAIPERIDFTRERLRQEGILNVNLIQASATALPLAENSFDLVVVNGVLEWVGDWDLAVHPRTAQINFLKKIRSLLKDDGVLLIGIENRFGLSSFLGNRDHSGLRYTSLVPRAVATFMLKRSSSRHYRTQKDTSKQYRTYTYSERGLRNLLSEAGFAEHSSYWADPGYNQPYDLVPLAVPAWVRQHSVELLHHPGLAPRRSWKRRARKIAVPFFQPFVSDFVLLASKQSGRSTKLQRWIEQSLMESDRTRADQAGRPLPIAWALHTRPFEERSIARIGDARTGSDLAYLKIFVGTPEAPLETEVANRSKVQESLNASAAAFLRVPRFCGTLRIGTTSYYMEEASRGSQISERVRALGYFDNLKRVERDFSQICKRILELTLALQHVSGVQAIPPAWREIPEMSAKQPELTSALAERRYFQQRSPDPSATWIQHGDLSVENAHFDHKTGELEVFDWCDLAGGLPPLYDFFQFFLSTGYLPRAAERISFASEEDSWIATFKALFFSDAAIGRLTRRLLLSAGERLKISADKIPSLLLEFLIIRSNYYEKRSPLQRRAQLRLLELCITDFESLQLAWESRSSHQALL